MWDTTIKKMTSPQIVYVAGHEMGHYVLWHIPKLLAFGAALLFVLFYLGYRTVDWVLARWAVSWNVRGLDDWASLPALLILISSLLLLHHAGCERHLQALRGTGGPVRSRSHARPDGPRSANVRTGVSSSGRCEISTIPSRFRWRCFCITTTRRSGTALQFCLNYDPWSKGQQGEFVP